MTMTTRIRGAMPIAALALLSALGLATACQPDTTKTEPAGRPATTSAASKTRAVAQLDPRSQHDLSRALAEVETASGQDGSLGYEKVRSSFAGKRYRWRVRVVAPLCRTRDACNVLPFEGAERAKGFIHGWMPHLVLDDTGFAAIQRKCTGQQSCQIEMEATLSELVLDPENPTSLEFRDVRVL